MQPAALQVAQGMCYALFAYDVGFSINLTSCAQRLTTMAERARISPQHRAPQYFEFRPAPLRLLQEVSPLTIGAYCSSPSVEVVLYDFGAVSITYHIPLHGPLQGLIALSEALADNAVLLDESRRRVEALLAGVQSAVSRPAIATFVEDYAIFQIDAFATPCPAAALDSTYAQDVARILRVDHARLSEQELRDALSHRLAYGLDDVTIIDWHAALVFDRPADDIRAVLEFANVELLEMRYLDEQLDHALDHAYDALSRQAGHWWQRSRSVGANLHRVGHMQVESAILFEGVNNTLKLIGDQYLARVYRLASQRFHLEAWDASIMRKLHTLDNIYQKMADQATTRRMEVLEWIIIVLIAVSILLPFFVKLPWH